MKFNAETKELFTQDDKLIKQMRCPLNKRWNDLLPISQSHLKRRCSACNRTVLNVTYEKEEIICALARFDNEACFYIDMSKRDIEIIDSDANQRTQPQYPCVHHQNEVGDRLIFTARSIEEIKHLEQSGCRVLIKKVEPNPDIYERLAVILNEDTGYHTFTGDLRNMPFLCQLIEPSKFIPIPSFTYYPYQFPAPIAAYILPDDLEVGERVFLVDLIEDYVACKWNQGPKSRLSSHYAVWNGTDFEVEWDNTMAFEIVG